MTTSPRKRLLLTLSAASVASLLAGCSGGSEGLHYYNLPPVNKPVAMTKMSGATISQPIEVSVSPVTLSDFLNGSGIVYQESDVEFNQAQLNLWADDISDQLTSTLAHNLQSQAGTFTILPSNADSSNADHLSVHLDAFQGRFDGMAVIHGSYQLYDKQQHLLLSEPINVTYGLAKNGYPALVSALSIAWNTVGNQIAGTLNSKLQSQ